MTQLALGDPIVNAIGERIQPKLVEIGWSIGGEESSPLSEYICLMIVNGKKQDQIAAELSGDLLGLAEGDSSAVEFAKWLFDLVEELKRTMGEGGQEGNNINNDALQGADDANGGDMEMKDSTDMQEGQDGIPTGPKAMRQPPGNRRLLGQLGKAMDRTQQDALHRIRPQGQDRVDKFKRDPPKGPSSTRPMSNRPNVPGRPHNNRMSNGRGFGPNSMQMPNMANMSPQQQHAFYQMFQQQAQMMQPYNGPPQQQQPPFRHGGPNNHHRNPQHDDPYSNNLAQPPRAGSLFDRIQAPPDEEPGMDTSASSPAPSHYDKPEEVACKFGTGCTKPECIFGHPSPSAPPNRGILYVSGDKCPYGANCKNRKCTGSHPSPASASAWATDKSQADCRFFPNCTNAACPFKHPAPRPPCRNGPNCTRPDCHFTHDGKTEIACRFNPCLNPACAFKHEEGQQQPADASAAAGNSFGNKVWTARPHMSERKFIADPDAQEELIIPGNTAAAAAGGVDENEMDTAPVDDGVE